MAIQEPKAAPVSDSKKQPPAKVRNQQPAWEDARGDLRAVDGRA